MESLANKYRPKCFAEVIGQQTVISILSKQIETKSFKQAYLFCGPTGCGKTTCARLFHRGVNNNESDPIDINAADNNGINLVRDLAADACLMPLDGEYKVYVVDECHQFTRAAWDAALKLIEEPPSNAIFIFCTTNPSKVPDTIMTRVQRFDFKRVSIGDIVNRLKFIMNEEFPGTKYDEEALIHIALKSNGFVREAITALDTCIVLGDVTTDNVTKALGVVKYEIMWQYINALLVKDSTKAFDYIKEMVSTRTDIYALIDDILSFMLSCEKLYLTHNINLVELPTYYATQIIEKNIDLMEYIDRLFKYSQLRLISEGLTLLNIFTAEICGGHYEHN